MKVPFVSFKPMEKELDKDLREAFDRVYTRSWYIEGVEDESFEEAFANYCDRKYCVGTGNGLDALMLDLKAIGIKEDDEVIYGKIIDITSNNSDEIAVDTSRSFEVVLITSSKEKKTISTEEIRIQNRAGRGTNVMVISLDDEITEVQFS